MAEVEALCSAKDWHLEHGQVAEWEVTKAGDIEETDLVSSLLEIPLR